MVLERYPDGIAGKTFYQKEAPEFLPEWIPTVSVVSESAGKSTQFILCNDRRALVYLANLGCISQHPWSSRVRSLEHPDFLIIDLDPEEGVPFSQVCRGCTQGKGNRRTGRDELLPEDVRSNRNAHHHSPATCL